MLILILQDEQDWRGEQPSLSGSDWVLTCHTQIESSPPHLCIFFTEFLETCVEWHSSVCGFREQCHLFEIRVCINPDRYLPCGDRFSFAVAAVLCSDSPVAVVALPELITLTSCSTPSHNAFKTAEGEPLGRVSQIMPAPCLSSPQHLISARLPPHALLWPPASETCSLHCPREFALVGSYAWNPLLPNTNMTFFLPHLFTQICPPSSKVFLVFWLNSSPRHVFPLPLFNFFLYDTHYYLMYFDIYYLSCYLTHSFHMRIQTPEDRDYFVSLAFFSTQKNA